MWSVDQAVGVADPEVVHGLPVTYHHSPLVAQHALVDGRGDLLAPFREDGGIILAVSTTEVVEMANEREG